MFAVICLALFEGVRAQQNVINFLFTNMQPPLVNQTQLGMRLDAMLPANATELFDGLLVKNCGMPMAANLSVENRSFAINCDTDPDALETLLYVSNNTMTFFRDIYRQGGQNQSADATRFEFLLTPVSSFPFDLIADNLTALLALAQKEVLTHLDEQRPGIYLPDTIQFGGAEVAVGVAGGVLCLVIAGICIFECRVAKLYRVQETIAPNANEYTVLV